MPVNITVSGESARHAQEEMAELLGGYVQARTSAPAAAVYNKTVEVGRATAAPEGPALIPTVQTEPTPESPNTVTNTERAGETEPRRRGRKSNAEKAAEAAAQQEPRTPPMTAAEAEAHRAPNAVPEDPQDAADEAEESAAEAAATVSYDDVRGALGAYVKKFGMPAAQEDGPKIIGYPKISDIPDDQEKLAKALDAVSMALETNPFSRAVQ